MSEKTKPGVTKKNGSITEQGLMIQNISVRPIQRGMLDIEKYRNNHKTAESINGTRVLLYDMYADILLDGFLKRLVAKRVLGVTKNKLKYIDKSGKEIPGADDVIKLHQFRKLRKRIQLYKAWGIAVIELMVVDGQLKIFDVPKKNIDPKAGKIIYEQYGVDGIEYRKPPCTKYVFEVGDWDDLGYLLEACAYAIYKRGNIADAHNFAQIFGQPLRVGRYDGFNDHVRIQLEAALEKAASAAYAVLPKDADIEFIENKGTAGSTELYNSLRVAMNEEMMVHVLGATESTTSSKSSGYAQSETHYKTVQEVAQDDKEDELAILNEQVLPILINLGLFKPGGKFVYDEPVDIETAGKKVDIALKMKEKGIPVGDDYFYEVSGVPKPDNYDELKQKIEDDKIQSQPPPVNKEEPVVPTGKPSKKKNKKKEKLSWFDDLKLKLADFFDQAHKN